MHFFEYGSPFPLSVVEILFCKYLFLSSPQNTGKCISVAHHGNQWSISLRIILVCEVYSSIKKPIPWRGYWKSAFFIWASVSEIWPSVAGEKDLKKPKEAPTFRRFKILSIMISSKNFGQHNMVLKNGWEW